MKQQSNKTIVLDFYKNVIGQRDTSLIDAYVSDVYIQHSPLVKDGKEGLLEAISYLKQMPETREKGSPVKRVLEDQNYVMVHLDIVFMGKRKAVIDLFRLEQGKLAEHWDAVQDYQGQDSDKASLTGGSATVNGVNLTNKNKSLVKRFFHEVTNNQSTDVKNSFLSPDYIEHDPEVTKATGRLGLYLSHRPGHSRKKAHKIIGEGNFVMVQSEGLKNNHPFVFYDIVRVENNQIIEHWSVAQAIPDAMAHKNGMI